MQVDTLINALREAGDPDWGADVRRYLKTSDLEFFGVRQPVNRQIAREYSRLVSEEDFVPYLRELWGYRVFEIRRAAAESMLHFIPRGMGEGDAVGLISEWLDDIDTWALTDPLGWCMGKLIVGNPDLSEVLVEWGRSDNRWRRRMSILPYVDICTKNQYRPEYGNMILKALEPHLGDREFFVAKAVGWALRQLSYHEPEMVGEYISQHRDQMSKLAIREGSRKLPRVD
jgi:3-methyladenine DNA glycosylase AlkD